MAHLQYIDVQGRPTEFLDVTSLHLLSGPFLISVA